MRQCCAHISQCVTMAAESLKVFTAAAAGNAAGRTVALADGCLSHAQLMTPRTRALIAAASSPINSPAPATAAAAPDLAVDSQGDTGSPARIPQPPPQQARGAAQQQRQHQQRSAAVRVSPRRGGRAAAAAAATESPTTAQPQQRNSPARLGRAASLARAASVGLFRRAPSLAHGMGGDATGEFYIARNTGGHFEDCI